MNGSRWRRSLLRRQQGALGAAPTRKAAADRELTRSCASHDATAGGARAIGGHGEAAIPGSKARTPAVATIILLAAVCCVSPARADDAPPPPTTPTSTTPNAPPPNPTTPSAPHPNPTKTGPPVVQSARLRPGPVRP